MPLPTKNRTLTLSKTPGNEDPPGKVWYPLKVHETPVPTPSTSTQLLLHPTHVALNHRDVFLRQHLYPAPAFDSTPMFSDAVAQVINKDGSDAGRRVLLNPGHGWEKDEKGPEKAYGIVGGTKTNPLGLAADYVLVEEVETAHCPEHLSGVEAAALPLCGLTGWRALVTKSGAAERGSNILVTGIGGGVALMVLLFAVKMGVNVWVSSGDEGKIAKAKELGAKGGVNYKTKGWEKELLGMLPKEKPMLDAIIDGAGGDVGDKAARLLKFGGVLVSYGMTVAPKISVPMSLVLKNIDVRGSTMGSRKEFQDMVKFVGEHKIKPVISRVVEGGLENSEGIESLFDDMKNGRQFGKLVISLDGGAAKGSKL